MSANPQTFRNADEKDELRWKIERLIKTGRSIERLRADPAFSTYLLAPAEKAIPLMPTQDEMTAAKAVLERAALCLMHHYNLRRRYDDEEMALIPEGSPFEQDNDTPF